MRVSKTACFLHAQNLVSKKSSYKQNQNSPITYNEDYSASPVSGALLKSYYLKQKTHSKVSFRAKPWYLDLPVKDSFSANEAIKLYNLFNTGNYLDIGDDKVFYERNNQIRKHNLSFLDRVKDTSEKVKFIDYYKSLTGFPNLTKVSENIESAFVKAVRKSSEELNDFYCSDRFNVIQAGYDGVCSVGRRKALPGSDLDKAYVIIKGSGSPYRDIEDVNRFKGHLWNNTDQRILSYNHDDAAFPQVYTINQIKKMLKAADGLVYDLGLQTCRRPLKDYLFGTSLFPNYVIKDTEKYARYLNLINTYHTDYIEANPFYIELCSKFPKKYDDKIDVDNPSRENIKNAGFTIEALREGVYFSSLGRLDYDDFYPSKTYNLTNLSQLRSLKKRNDAKPKRLARENLEKDFNSWGIDKQFRFIKTLIESACSNNTDFTDEFPQYFSKAGNDMFLPLMKVLMAD